MQLPFDGFYSLQKLLFRTDQKMAILKKIAKFLKHWYSSSPVAGFKLY